MDGDGKRTVTLELDAALVDAASKLGTDLSFTVERALRRHLPRPMTDEERTLFVQTAVERHDRHGSAGEEHTPR